MGLWAYLAPNFGAKNLYVLNTQIFIFSFFSFFIFRKTEMEPAKFSGSRSQTQEQMEKDSKVFFYSNFGAYVEFSNFYTAPFTVNGKIYATVEHFYQSQKFIHNTEYAELIREAPTAYVAKMMGGSRQVPIRTDWEDVKEGVMRKALVYKFTTHYSLASLLISTGEKQLVEHSRDTFWGDGLDGTGSNHLGRILMTVRETIKEYSNMLSKIVY